MLDQEKTGRFIAQCRKDKGLTQRQLAEHLGISDKTVSKWETGNGMPDTSLMQPLCELLSINVNELLSAEHLSTDSYHGKAEENMMTLMKEKETVKGTRIGTIVTTVLGLLICALYFMATKSMYAVVGMLDFPSFLGVVGVLLLAVGLSGQVQPFFRGVRLLVVKKTDADADIIRQLTQSAEAFSFAARICVLAGIVGFIWDLTMMLHYMSKPETLGPSLMVAMLSLFYGVLFAILFSILAVRLRRKLH